MRLGIDIGTTKTAAVIYDWGHQELLAAKSVNNNAGTRGRDADKIIQATFDAIAGLPADLRRQVTAIGMTGQMHGIICWSGGRHSDFENWQSTRTVDTGTLAKIKQLPGCEGLFAGAGFATLAIPEFRAGWQHCGTIMDYFGAILCNTLDSQGKIEASNAASWGLWNFTKRDWNYDAVTRLGIPREMLPQVCEVDIVGSLDAEMANKLGLPTGIPVITPVGDNPAAILGSKGNVETDLFITIGTGAQLAFVPKNTEKNFSAIGYDKRPFPGLDIMFVKAPLCGGKSLEVLAKFIAETCDEFGAEVSLPKIYDTIAEPNSVADDTLKVCTSFAGERHDVNLQGSVTGISQDNFTFRKVCRAWNEGLIETLIGGLPQSVINARKRIVVNGNAIRRSPALLQILKERLPRMEIVLPDSKEEAACGSTLFAKA